MTFLNAIFLAGLATVAVPVILHLIQRQRYPERRFTTLRFFDVTVKHNVIQRRLIDRLLLALRVLALLALFAGLARPFARGGLGEKRLSLVVVLDNSPSMGRSAGADTLLERARGQARSLLAALGPADRAALVLTAPDVRLDYTTDRAALKRALALRRGRPTALVAAGADGRSGSVPGLTTDTATLEAALDALPATVPAALCGPGLGVQPELTQAHAGLRTQLETLTLSARPGSVIAALETAGRLLAPSRDGDRRIVLLSDLQASEWSAAVTGLQHCAVSVYRLEPAAAAAPNLGIEDCTLIERDVGLGETAVGTAVVRNYGTEDSRAGVLRILPGERARELEVAVPPVAAGQALRVEFAVPAMTRERSMLCSLRLDAPGDAFAYDNEWHFQLGVRAPISVLCVHASTGTAPSERAGFYLMSALALPGAIGRGANRLDVRECALEDLEAQSLFQYRVVVLAGVDRLSDALRVRLRQFVSDGGGLLIFPGRGLEPAEGNAWGFLPATLVQRHIDRFTSVQSLSERAPAIAGLQERTGSEFYALSSRDWLELAPAADAVTLARFGGDYPALVDGRLGAGRIILAATGCQTTESDWPLRPIFPVLIHMLTHALGAPTRPLALAPLRVVGDSAARSVPRELAGGTPAAFALARREGRLAYEALPWVRNDHALVLAAAEAPGQYVLALRPGKAAGLLAEPGVGADLTAVSVNHAAEESRLAALNADAAAAFMPGARVEELTLGSEATPAALALHTGGEFWRLFLALALVALVAESLVGWRSPSQSMS